MKSVQIHFVFRSMQKTKFLILSLFLLMTSISSSETVLSSQFLSPQDILKIPFSPTIHKLSYGQDKKQFGDLRIPDTDGPHPILVIIHGGCWTSKIATVDFMSSFAEAFS